MLTHENHTLREFDSSLNQLHQCLMSMAYKAQAALDLSISGCLQQNKEALNQVIADDEEIDELEKQVDEKSLHFLAFFSPVAADLRLVLTTIRLSGMYERIGDECVNISKRSKKLAKHSPIREIIHLEPIYQDLAHIFRKMNKAVAYWDVKSLEIILPNIQEITYKAQFLTHGTSELTQTYPDNIVAVSELVFIARSLEKIAEHFVKIVEEAMLVSLNTEQ